MSASPPALTFTPAPASCGCKASTASTPDHLPSPPHSPSLPRKRRRPPHSYAVLIAQAILASPTQRLTLREIYQWLAQHYPTLYNLQDTDWQNTIRHNLSLNKCFVKVAREPKSLKKKRNEPLDNSVGKGGYWTVDEEHLPSTFVPLHRGVDSYLSVPCLQDEGYRKRKRSPSPMAIAALLN